MKVILDTNIWISFLLGHQAKLIRRILTDSRYDVYVCKELLDEIQDVANRPKIRRTVSANEVRDLLYIITAFCKSISVTTEAQANIRDDKDLYLLSLAESIGATYIVSGDADLTTLHHYKGTQIIRLTEFKGMMLYS